VPSLKLPFTKCWRDAAHWASTGAAVQLIAVGGTTINGLDASGVSDGFTTLMQNPSATDNLVFAHLASASQPTNSVAVPPLEAARCTYVVKQWRFA
jgi:hypothetical protein